ncbi:MAG: DUF2868 domain-containing protein [Burkholderiales bacterium]
MNEHTARQVLLVRAAESDATLITDADRHFAGRAAAELAGWRAADVKGSERSETYIVERAKLLDAKLRERDPRLSKVINRVRWRPWVGRVGLLVAFGAGVALDQITDAKRINLLAFPLLGLILWNLVVYAVLALRTVVGLTGWRPSGLSLFKHWIALGMESAREASERGLIGRFALAWRSAAAPLTNARIARVLHCAAALFAAGVIAGLYMRGLVLDYRAGWESTFLEPNEVRRVLDTLLGPAARLIGQSIPTVEQIALLHFSRAGAGENAARWILYYAITVAALVIVPRLLLALWNGLREWRLARKFPLPLHEPYFRRLLAIASPQATRLRATPYSYTLETGAVDGLRAIARRLFGESTQLALATSVDYGQEDKATGGDVAVFNLAATPESENHGAFLDRIRAGGASTIALVDESAYRQRLGSQAGAEDRIGERRRAWEALVRGRGLEPLFVDLSAPDLDAVERRFAEIGVAPR